PISNTNLNSSSPKSNFTTKPSPEPIHTTCSTQKPVNSEDASSTPKPIPTIKP
ncbi:hypothetical protein S83_037860, partial [Arachis hypogaea]